MPKMPRRRGRGDGQGAGKGGKKSGGDPRLSDPDFRARSGRASRPSGAKKTQKRKEERVRKSGRAQEANKSKEEGEQKETVRGPGARTRKMMKARPGRRWKNPDNVLKRRRRDAERQLGRALGRKRPSGPPDQ